MTSPPAVHRPGPARAESRWALAVLVATGAALCLVVVPFVVGNNLLAWDMVGHWTSAEYTRRHLWPWPYGWNPWFYCGTPHNQLYPPVLGYGAATLGQLLGTRLGLKLLVGAAVLATPPSFYALGRSVGLRPVVAALAALAMSAWMGQSTEEIGGNLHSTFHIGNFTNAVGLPVLFLYLAALRHASLERRSFAWPTVLLALATTTHLVVGLVALFAMVVERLWTVWRDAEARRWQLRATAVHAGVGFTAGAWFTLPFLEARGAGSADILNLTLYPEVGWTPYLYLPALALLLAAPARTRDALAPLAVVAACLFAVRAWVPIDTDLPALVLRSHRLKSYECLIAILGCAGFAQHAWRLPRGARIVLATAATLASLGVLVAGLLPMQARGVPDQPFPVLPGAAGRTLVVSGPHSQVAPHANHQLAALATDQPAGRGLFVEAAAHGRLVTELERAVAHPQREVNVWSIALEPPPRLVGVLHHAPRILDRLGFGALLSNEPLNPALAPVLPRPASLGFGYQLTTLPPPRPVEALEQWPLAVPPRDFHEAVRSWFLAGAFGTVLESSTWSAPPGRPAAATISDLEVSTTEDHWRFEVQSPEPVPVLIKATWSPAWTARGDAGQPLPLIRATPYFMVTVAQGLVELRYSPTSVQRLSAALSLGTWVVLVGWLAWPRVRHQSPRRRRAAVALLAVLLIAAATLGAVTGLVRPPSPTCTGGVWSEPTC